MGRLASIRRLSWSDRWLLAQAGLLLFGVRLAVSGIGYQRVYRTLARTATAPRGRGAAQPPATAGLVEPVTRALGSASRHLPVRTSCLHRSLVLWWLLSRRGLNCVVRMGARRRGGRFEAHAWVEQDGHVIGEDAPVEGDYVPLGWTPAN